jgi:hypothetical protein
VMPRCEPTDQRKSLTVDEARALIAASNGEPHRCPRRVRSGPRASARGPHRSPVVGPAPGREAAAPFRVRLDEASTGLEPVPRTDRSSGRKRGSGPSFYRLSSPRWSPTGRVKTTSGPIADAGTTRALCSARRSGHRSTPATSARCSPGSQRGPGSRAPSRTRSGTQPRCSSGRHRSGRRPPRRRSEDALPPLPSPGPARRRGGRRTDADLARRDDKRPRTLTDGTNRGAARRAMAPQALGPDPGRLRGGQTRRSGLVEAKGIEPTTSCMPCKRSTN